VVLLHLLEAERQLLRLAGEDVELLDHLLGRHLAAATALELTTADLGRNLSGSLELTGNRFGAGHLTSRRRSSILTAAAVAAATTAGKRESRTRRPRLRHFLFVLTQDNFYAEHMRQSGGVAEGSTVNFCAEATAFVRK